MFSLRAGDVFVVDGRAALFFNDAAKLRQRRCGSRIIHSFFFNFFFGIGLLPPENIALTFFKKAVKMVIWSFVIFDLENTLSAHYNIKIFLYYSDDFDRIRFRF